MSRALKQRLRLFFKYVRLSNRVDSGLRLVARGASQAEQPAALGSLAEQLAAQPAVQTWASSFARRPGSSNLENPKNSEKAKNHRSDLRDSESFLF